MTRETKQAIGEAIMSEPSVFDPAESRLTYQEVLALGELKAARKMVSSQLRRRLGRALPDGLQEAVAACDDPARLDEALSLIIDEGDPNALVEQVLQLLSREQPR